MASIEHKLISKAAHSGGVERLISSGISSRHFLEPKTQEIWNYMVEHVKKYKVPPPVDNLQEQFEGFRFEIVEDSLDYLKDQFIIAAKRFEATGALQEIAEVLDEGTPDQVSKIDELFLDRAKQLAQVVPSSRISKFSDMDQRIITYQERKRDGKLPGIPFGLPALDEITLGLQPHEYLTLAGFAGTGKSSLCLFLLFNAYLEGRTPMMVSLEMDEEQIYRKLDAMAIGAKQFAFKSMRLNPREVEAWEAFSERAGSAANDIIIVDVDEATPEKVFAETSRWNPDLVAVDYIQLLDAPSYLKQSWERVGHISKQMKLIARQLKTPVYGLSQTNTESAKEGAKLENLAQSRQIAAHSDIVLGLDQNEEMREMNKINVRVLKNRDGPRTTLELFWEPSTMVYKPWKEEYAAQAFKKDTEAELPKGARV